MRILIDILHPAHVHVFKHFHREMLARGHEVLVSGRDKDVALDLLQAYDMPVEVLSEQKSGPQLVIELAVRTARLIRLARRWKPDVLTGIMGPSIALAGGILGIPAVVLYDTEIASVTNRWVYPLAAAVITPNSYQGRVRGNHLTYPGSHELAYLHPSRFEASPEYASQFGIKPREVFTFLRFVSWNASHDTSLKGLSGIQQRSLVERLQQLGRVMISAEGPLPRDLESLRISGPVELVHHALSQASAYIGESATMASEAATLGVPTYYIAQKSRGYIDELERAGLLQTYTPQQFDLLLADLNAVPERNNLLHSRWLKSKTDVTSWLVEWFEENHGR